MLFPSREARSRCARVVGSLQSSRGPGPRWEDVLADPLGGPGAGPAFDPPLEAGLVAHLQALAGPDVAANHGRLARAAEDALEKLVGDAAEMVMAATSDAWEPAHELPLPEPAASPSGFEEALGPVS